jgi:hypothetical protein
MHRLAASLVAAMALVVVPIGVGAYATAQPAASHRLADEPFVRPYLGWVSSTVVACRWTHRHADVRCLLADGERCTVEIGRQQMACATARVSVSSAPAIGYGAPSTTGGDG